MSASSQLSDEANRQQNRVKGDDRRARWTMKYFFGIMIETHTPFDVGNAAFDEKRYQDAVDAYTMAISFRFDNAHETLARRAEAYMKLNKFREAYIDANEAVKFRNQRREQNSSSAEWLQRVFYSKAVALRHLGFEDAAFLNWELGLRMGPGNTELEAEFRAAAVKLCGKIAAQTVRADFLTNYDPLESDSPEFGRELLLGDINRFILNNWQRPLAGQDPLKFDFFTWRSVYSLLNFLHVESLKTREGGVMTSIREILQAHTLRLCFADTDWRNRASCLGLLVKHEAFYLNAKKEYDVCLEHGNLGGMANAAATMASALKELGLVYDAKRALEPALRFLRLGDPHKHGANKKYAQLKLQKDHPKIAFEDLLKMDPLDSFEGDHSVEIVRKIRPAYIEAMTAERESTASTEENSRLKADLKAANKAKNQLDKQVEELKSQVLQAKTSTTTEKEKKLEQLLIEKERELAHARQVYEALQHQNHELKSAADRVKEERKSWKSSVKSTEELQQDLEKAQQECAKAEAIAKDRQEAMDHMQATEEEFKRKNRGMTNHSYIIRRLQRHNTEYDLKLRKLEERKESLEKQLTDKRVENSGLLSQLLDAIEALKTEEERHGNAPQNGSETTALSSPSAADSERLEAFKNGVYATLTGNVDGYVDGYADMRTLLEHLREDTSTDGDTKAREFGFQSLEAFLRSTAMKGKVFIQDGEDGTVYKARPNATNRHLHDARVISAEAAARRRDRRAFFDARDRMQSAVDDERNRANALAEELNEVRQELRRQRDETAELEKEARCQICMDGRPNQTTYVVRNNDADVACGHVSCHNCAQTLTACPTCSLRIVSRIRFYL